MDGSNTEGNETALEVDPWSDSQRATQEIKEKHFSVNYPQIVRDARVLFLGERHDDNSIREHIISSAVDLKAAGITHYAIEAPEVENVTLTRFNRGEQVDLSTIDVGPARFNYEQAILAMNAQGIQVVAVDIDQNSSPARQERESRMSTNLLKVIKENPNSKIAYLVGMTHAIKKPLTDKVKSAAQITEEAGIKTVTAVFAGGIDSVPRNLTSAVRDAGLESAEFALDFRPYITSTSKSIPYGRGRVDFVIHLPRTNFYPRPDFLPSHWSEPEGYRVPIAMTGSIFRRLLGRR